MPFWHRLLSPHRRRRSDQQQRRNRPRRSNQQPLRPLVALVVLIVGAATGYRLVVPGFSWGDAFWMVLITLTTVGYGEVQPLGTGGRIVTTLLLLGGLLVVQLLIQRFVQLSNSGYFRRLRLRSQQTMVNRLSNHVILCGYGAMGQEVAHRIRSDRSEDVEVVVIDRDPERVALAHDHGFHSINGDASLDDVLSKAGLVRAFSLVTALGSDADNLYVVLSAKAMAPEVKVIARAATEEAANKLRLARADDVVSPYVAGGRAIAAKALHPEAASFMELLAGTEYEVERIQLSRNPDTFRQLPGNTLARLNLGRNSGVLVLAIRSAGGVKANPGGQTQLLPGDELILLGSKVQRQAAERLLGLAAEDVEVITDHGLENRP